jgi:threonylcarbamoyladenosine tRNA methylthiotransferase MtaB
MNQNNIELNYSTVAFLTLGCKVNSYETDAMQKLFEDAGFQVVDFSEHADIYVVNTCTVTNIADRKSRQMLHKARKMNEKAVVVAVGCYVQAAKDALEQDESIDLVIGNNKKKDIIAILKDYNKGNTIQDNEQISTDIIRESAHNENIIDLSHETEYEDLSIASVAEKTRAYIKIQDGCNQFCSYCIIPYARGRVRSRAKAAVIEEVKNIVQKGYKEIVLTGIHLSSYGIDFTDDNSNMLLDLILDLSKIQGLLRIRLGSLEPRIITEEFANALASNEKFCPHFHLSLQSGCNETLKRMNRKYTTEEYFEKCELLRKYFVNPAITTDIIVGFPGETDEEFETTTKFLKKIAFSKMHVFKYSVRKGTKAENMPNQVKEEKKSERSNCLLELEAAMANKYQNTFVGKEESILIEEYHTIDGNTYQIGHNERYLKLAIQSEKDYTNEIVQGRVQKFISKEIMFCEIMD